MNYIITEELLMSYLYGEMDQEEKAQFEKALETNPKWKEELDQLTFLNKQLHRVEDEDVPQGIIISTEAIAQKKSFVGWLKPIAAVAAAIALLMILASVTRMHIRNYDGGLSITFGEPISQPTEDSQLLDQDLNHLVQAALDARDEQWRSQLFTLQDDLGLQVSNQKNAIQQVSEQLKNINRSPNQNHLTLADLDQYLSKTRKEDKDEIEKMISNLFEYMTINRDKDLQMIQTGFNDIRQTINLSDLERQQVLASYQDINLNQ